MLSEVHVADVSAQVAFSLLTEFENFSVFQPAAHQQDAVSAMLDQVISWAMALQPLRMAVSA